MLKEDEIVLLDDIASKVHKLLNAKDSYTKTFLTPYISNDIEVDISIMANNIKSDFPLFLLTKMERILSVQKEKNKNYQAIIKRQMNMIKQITQILDQTTGVMGIQINGMANNLELIHEHDDKVLKWLLLNSTEENEDFIYENWPIDVILNVKIDNDIKLNDRDKERIRLYTKQD